MNLSQRLDGIRLKFESGDTPREIIDVLNGNIRRLLAADAGKNALAVGDDAPIECEVFSEFGNQRLSHWMGERFLVLTWFRGNW